MIGPVDFAPDHNLEYQSLKYEHEHLNERWNQLEIDLTIVLNAIFPLWEEIKIGKAL